MELAEKPKVHLNSGSENGSRQGDVISDLLSSTGAAAQAVHGTVDNIHSPASDSSSKQKKSFFAMANEMHNSSHSDSGTDAMDSCLNFMPPSSGYGTATLSQLKMKDPLMTANLSKLLSDPRNLVSNSESESISDPAKTMHGIDTGVFSNHSSLSSKNSEANGTTDISDRGEISDNQVHSEDQLSIPTPKIAGLQRPISGSDPTLYPTSKTSKSVKIHSHPVSKPFNKSKADTPKSVMTITKEAERLDNPNIVNVVSTQNVSSSEESSDRSHAEHPAIISDEEPIITVLARNGHRSSSERLSSRSSICSDSSQEKVKARDHISRFHPGKLQQGKLISGGASSTDSLHSGELSVSQYAVGQKQKFFNDNSLKRPTTNVARKKIVEPKLVQPVRRNDVDARHRVQATKVQEPAQNSDVAATAALAAASVVAASQPFLQVQQTMDIKITQLTEKIAELVTKGPPPPSGGEYNHATEARIKFLENQVENLTNKRLEYLEHLQKQQMFVQDRLVRANEQQQGQVMSQESKENKKPTIIYKEVLPNDTRQYARMSRSEPTLNTHEKSMFDTPAPRRRPPSPTSYEAPSKKEVRLRSPEPHPKKDPAFLAQILATPEPSPKTTAFVPSNIKDYPLRSKHVQSHTVNRAKELERSMDNLNEHLKSTVFSAPEEFHLKGLGQQEGPYPLDFYLADRVEPIPSSPYPDFSTTSTKSKETLVDHRGNAPVNTRYIDAKSTLKHTQALKEYLEGNLESVLRSRQGVDVFSEKGLYSGIQPENARVKKMVDKHINSLNSEVERDIMQKLLEVNEKYDAKSARATRMIPERDTNTQSKVAPKKFKARPAPSSTRPKPPSSKELHSVPPVPKLKKTTKPSTKFSKDILSKPFSAEKTVRQLPIRQQSPYVPPAPKPQPAPIRTQPVPVAVPMPLFKPSVPKFTHSQGQMIPMAIPLRSPRKHTFPQPPTPGLEPAHEIAGPQMTSTPVIDSHTLPMPKTPPPSQHKVTRQESAPAIVLQPSPSPIRDAPPPGHQLEKEEVDDTFTTDGGEQPLSMQSNDQIEIDGEAPPVVKPKVTLWDEKRQETYQRHLTLVQDRACQWLGQEILAQMTRQVYSEQMPARDTIPHHRTADVLESDEEDLSEAPEYQHVARQNQPAPIATKPKVVINPGVDMTDNLVNALLKEVLVERIKSSIISRPGPSVLENIVIKEQPETTVPEQESEDDSSIMRAFNRQPVREEYVVSPPTTPELTPRHSPAPPLFKAPPSEDRPDLIYNPTPDVTPAVSVIDDQREPPVYSSDFESEEEEIVPLKTLNGVALDESQDTMGGPRYDLSTPEMTPPPSPPHEQPPTFVTPPRTPSPSLRQPSPEPVPEPVEDLPVDEIPVEEPQIKEEEAAPAEEEEQDEYDESFEEDDEKPEMVSVGVEVAESLGSPPPASPAAAPSTPLASDTQSVSSPVSDTVNDRLSEGQWLISVQSEGEVPGEDYSDLQELALKKNFAGTRVTKRRDSNDDTLLDTDDLDQDRSDMEVSEGEFLHRAQPDPDRNAQLQVSPEFKKPLSRMIHVTPPRGPTQPQNGVPTDVSLGEVSIGQRLMASKNGHGDSHRMEGYSRAFAEDPVKRQQLQEERKDSPTASEDEASEARAAPVRVSERSPSPNQRYAPLSRGGMGRISPTGNRGRPAGGMIMSTGMPRDRARVRPGLSGQLPQRGSRTMSPEPKRISGTLSGDLGDMLSSRDSFQATQSDLETRTMTPDQMNVEALLQSRDYYSTTQSDFGSTDFTNTNQPDEYTEVTNDEEEAAPSPSPRNKPRQVSVTIPSMVDEDETESLEDVSEYT